MKTQVRAHLITLQQALERHQLWESIAPSAEALASTEPFAVDVLTPTQWLQWIFIPRMYALLEVNGQLPTNFAITPYLEEALKDESYLADLHTPLLQLETLLKA